MNAVVSDVPATARLLRVEDSQEFFGRLSHQASGGTEILAEGLQSLCDQDLFVVSYETQGNWHVFLGRVATDHGVVETSDGLHLRSLVMLPTTPLGIQL